MGKIILFGIVLILVIYLVVTNYSSSRADDTSADKEKQTRKEEIQELIDTLQVKIIKFREEAEGGKEEAKAKYEQYVQELEIATKLMEKYK